jgi:hypothetical protein
LLLLAGIFVLLAIHRWRKRGLAEDALISAVVLGSLVTAVAEGLSAFRLLTPRGVLGCWILVALISAVAWRAGPRGETPSRGAATADTPWTLWAVGAAALLLLATALLSPPNTWDAMSYHMSRVLHWIQNRSLEPYPTHITRQVYMPPWSGLAIVQLQLLAGSDRLANTVQWAAMLGSVLTVSWLARLLGAGRGGQALAPVVAVTIPMGILQATSTQTDHVVGFWLVTTAALGLRFGQEPGWALGLATGGALGLAGLSKPTAYLYGLPLLLWLAASLPRKAVGPALKVIVPAAALALALNAEHFRRNVRAFGSPFGPGDDTRSEANSRPRAEPEKGRHAVSRILKNLGLHFAGPVTPLNGEVLSVMRRLDGWSGESLEAVPFDMKLELSPHEDLAGNPWHLLLLVFSSAYVLSRWQRLPRATFLLPLALLGASLVFVGFIRWAPWNSRLHLPLFVLAAPLVALAAERILPPRGLDALAAVLLVLAVPWLLRNHARRLVGEANVFTTPRESQYFRNDPSREEATRRAADVLRSAGCRTVALTAHENDWEYPLRVLSGAEFRFLHAAVTNRTGRLPAEPESEAADCSCDLSAVACRAIHEVETARP